MSNPTVSVLIATFNRACYLPECLESVLAQTIRPTQVIVINDGSTDNTREVLAPYMDRIEYIEKPNGGKASALNLGLSRARGDYIWIMDDDDAGLPEALETHLNVLEEDQSIGFTWTTGYYAREGPGGGRLEIVEPGPAPEIPDDGLFLRMLKGNVMVFHSALLCRTSCYRAVGPFNTELIRSQDYEMNLRLTHRYAGRRIDKPTVLYRIHSGSRGSEAGRFEAEEIGLKHRQYNQKILSRFRNELELHEYLPVDLQSEPLGHLEIRRAYLQRMAIMASAGLMGEMVEDLHSALSAADSPLTSVERELVQKTMEDLSQCDLAVLRRTFPTRTVGATQLGRQLQEVIADALYRRAVKGAKGRHPREIVAVVRTGRRVHGIRGFLQAMRRVGKEG